ncbi:MAG: Glutathione transport system permease protein GsiC [Syntrophomonadaceae bacterium]|nr:Glutathione transport system permease protein GsiC [Bacillota bacterium]
MWTYIIRRILMLIPTLLGIFTVVFLALRLAPGCPAELVVGGDPHPGAVEAMRIEMGLDKPLHVQYLLSLGNVFRGDLGYSVRTRRPVTDEILARFPATIELAVASMLWAIVVGIFAGSIAATKQNSIYDNVSMVGALFGISAPVFWLGLMLMLVFSVHLGWFPTVGRGTALHLVLPAITLGSASIAVIARQTRSSMLEVIRQDYIRTARAKGLKEQIVIAKHALKNALIPVITVIGLQFGVLLGGAVLTETIFAWPGVGRLLVDAIFWRDFPLVQGGVILIATIFVVVNLLVDISYIFVDPRIRSN